MNHSAWNVIWLLFVVFWFLRIKHIQILINSPIHRRQFFHGQTPEKRYLSPTIQNLSFPWSKLHPFDCAMTERHVHYLHWQSHLCFEWKLYEETIITFFFLSSAAFDIIMKIDSVTCHKNNVMHWINYYYMVDDIFWVRKSKTRIWFWRDNI